MNLFCILSNTVSPTAERPEKVINIEQLTRLDQKDYFSLYHHTNLMPDSLSLAYKLTAADKVGAPDYMLVALILSIGP